MKTMLKSFWRDDQGQDILEYMLLLGFIVAASVAFYITAGGNATWLWITRPSQAGASTSSS